MIKSILLALLAIKTIYLSGDISRIDLISIGNIALKNQEPIETRKKQILGDEYPGISRPQKHHSIRTVSAPHISSFEEKKICFQLSHSLHPICHNGPAVLDMNAIRSLPILTTQHGEHTLLNLFPTTTIWGYIQVAQYLSLPLSNKKNIVQRQSCVRFLLENPQIHSKILLALRNIQEHNGTFLTFFQENTTTTEIINQLYFSSPDNNKSFPKMLWLRGYHAFCNKPEFIALRLIAQQGIFLAGEGLREQINNRLPVDLQMNKVMATERGEKIFKTMYFLSSLVQETLISYIANRYSSYNSIDRSAIDYIKMRYRATQALLQSLKQIFILVEEIPVSYRPELTNISNLLNSKNSDINKLLEYCNTTALHAKENPNFIDTAHLLVANKLIETTKLFIASALNEAGIIDAFSSAATLYHTNKSHYCFTDFADDHSTVIVHFEKCWNPLLNQELMIKNSLILDQTGHRNIIISGPNGSGKSIFLKSIALNYIMAQSFGITAAEKACLRKIDHLFTYFNVQEDADSQQSTFMAEKQRLDSICQHVEQCASCTDDYHTMAIIDEPLKGTVEQTGASLVFQAGLTLGLPANNTTIMATHLNKPTTLSDHHQASFVNYHMEIAEPLMGHFVRTFTILPQKNPWWFSDADKRDRFIVWLSAQESQH